MTLGIIAATFINLVMSITAQRESGVLKRRRATPVPASALIAGRALTAVVTAIGSTVVLLAIGWTAFGAHVPARTAPLLALTVVVGAVSFCCLGYAGRVGGPRPGRRPAGHPGDHAAPVLHLRRVHRRLYPARLARRSGHVFPVSHLAAALLTAYNPHTRGAGFAGTDLLIVAAWGAAGLLIAVRRFSWLPLGR